MTKPRRSTPEDLAKLAQIANAIKPHQVHTLREIVLESGFSEAQVVTAAEVSLTSQDYNPHAGLVSAEGRQTILEHIRRGYDPKVHPND